MKHLCAFVLCLCLLACTSNTIESKPAESTSASQPVTAVSPGKGGGDKTLAQSPFDHRNPDRSCQQDSDCEIKDVGNCCGYYPSCVNKDAKTDPAKVKAECEKEGMMGVCGFPAIESCQCVANRCEGVTGIGGGSEAPQ